MMSAGGIAWQSLVVVGALLLYLLLDNRDHWPWNIWDPRLTIQRKRFSAEAVAQALKASKPVVFTDVPLNEWPASTWSFQRLGKELQPLQVKAQKGDQRFMYFNHDQTYSNGPVAKECPHLRATPGHRVDVLPAGTLIDSVTTPKPHTYWYSSGPLESLLPPALRSDVPLSTTIGLGDSAQQNIWIASNGTTASAHYDTSDNVYFPILGSKSFLLAPPSEHLRYHLFPSMHAFYRHAQSFDTHTTVRVTLTPGEALFLPAYWFHQVESLGPSVSVNYWAESQAYHLMEEAFLLPIPFESSWESHKLSQATGYYLNGLLRRLDLPFHLFDIFGTRYSWLCEEHTTSECSMGTDLITKDQMGRMDEAVDRLAIPFLQLGNTSERAAIRQIYFQNYAEYLAAMALGSEATPGFLRSCLTGP